MSNERKYSVALRFFAVDLEPDEISGLLGIDPTSSYRQGDIRRTRSGRALGEWKRGGWIHSKKVYDVESLEKALDGFLRNLSDSKEEIRSISCRPDMQADIYIADLRGLGLQFPAIVLSLATLETLAEMALEFECTFYGWEHTRSAQE